MRTCVVAPTDIPKKSSARRFADDMECKSDVISTVVNSFVASDNECVECFDDAGIFANSNNFRRSFQRCIERRRIKGIYVTIRGDRVFLVRKGVLDDEDN